MTPEIMLVDRLQDLIRLAREAKTEYERAAIYAASCAISDQFNHEDEENGYLLEKVRKTVWSIHAILGYDPGNGHDSYQHASWATGALDTLRDLIEERSR